MSSFSQARSEEEMKYCRVLSQFLNSYTVSAGVEDNSRAFLDCIRQSSVRFSEHLRNKNHAMIYLEAIFEVMEIFRATDKCVIRNWLEEYAIYTLRKHGMLWVEVDPPSLLKHFPLDDIFYEPNAGYEKKFTVEKFFYPPLLLVNFEEISRLLRYGLTFTIEDSELIQFLQSMLIRLIRSSNMVNFETEEELKHVESLIKLNYVNFAKRKRLYFVLLAIKIIAEKETPSGGHVTSAESLKLVFKTLPDPLISVQEIRNFFNLIVKDENKRSDTQEFCNKLKDIFPRISEPLQPRSLLHLCRCQVRGSLAQSRSLPHGVWKLNIPLTLKNYIMLQKNQNDYRGNFDLASKKRSVGDSLVSCKRVRRN